MNKNLKLEEIKRLYSSGLNGPQIAKIYSVCKKTITNLLLKNNIKLRTKSQQNRKYRLNEAYFEVIDTQEKAYFLGLLYADGCMLEKKHTIKIGLKSNDYKLLESLSKFIYIDFRPLEYETRKTTYSKNELTMSTLRISSIVMYNDLLTHGLTPRKSLTLDFPKTIPNHLLSHFLRGYLDGDGWISVTTRKYKGLPGTKRITCGFLCSEAFSIKLIELIKSLDIKPHIVKDHRCNEIFDVRMTSNKGSKILLDWLYKDATICLDRKYNKYKSFNK